MHDDIYKQSHVIENIPI